MGPGGAQECCPCTEKIVGIFQAGLLENSKEENQDKWYYIYDQYSGKTGTIIIDNVTKETKSNP